MSYPSLNFALGETIDMLRDQVQSFVAKELAPRAAQIDIDNLFPADMWRKFGDMGLLGITVPEEYGGAGLGYLAHVVAMEEISLGRYLSFCSWVPLRLIWLTQRLEWAP